MTGNSRSRARSRTSPRVRRRVSCFAFAAALSPLVRIVLPSCPMRAFPARGRYTGLPATSRPEVSHAPVRRRVRPQPVPRPPADGRRPPRRLPRWPGGTQTPQRVLDAVLDYLANHNCNIHGAFATSEETDAVVQAAREAGADLLGCDWQEVSFGANMTTLSFLLSDAIARDIRPGRRSGGHAARPRGQPRSVAAAGRARRRHPRGARRPRDVHARLGRPREAHRARQDPGGRRRLRVERRRHGQRRRARGCAGPRGRRAQRRRRRALRAARADRRAGHRLRLPALLRLQVLRPARRAHVRAPRGHGGARAGPAEHAGARSARSCGRPAR